MTGDAPSIAGTKVRVGIVGAGAIVQKVHLPVLVNLPEVRIAWIADRDEALARRVARNFWIGAVATGSDPAAWPACDLVLLATPLHARESYLQHYARSAIPVFAEKPFALSARDHAAHLAAFAGTQVFCGYMRRGYASIRMLRRLVASGCLGAPRRVRYAEGGRTTGTASGSATLDLSYRRGGGVLRDLGCHGLDALLFITGARDARVESASIEWDEQTDRHVEALISLDSGGERSFNCPVEFNVSWLLPQANTIEIDFERASIRCGIKPGSPAQLAPEGDFARALPFDMDDGGARGEYASYYAEWNDVLTACRVGTDGEYAASSSLATTQLVDAIYAAGRAP